MIRGLVLALLLLTACGGGGPEPVGVAAIPAAPERAQALDAAPVRPPVVQTPAAPPAAPEQPTQPEAPPVAPVEPPAAEPPPAPVVAAVEPGPAWADEWGEQWQAPVIGGWTRADARVCRWPSLDDPGSEPRREFGVRDWTTVGQVAHGIVSMTGGALTIDSTQHAGGWALLSGPTFDHERAIRVTTTIDLTPDPGAWIGVTLHHGDGNYREIGIAEHDGLLRGMMHAPCYWAWVGDVLPAGPHTLMLEYDPATGWRMSIDDALIYSEPIGFKANRLLDRPNVGIFVVNLMVEGRKLSTGVVRATVGPVVVHTIQGPQ